MYKINENIFHLYDKWKEGYVRKETALEEKIKPMKEWAKKTFPTIFDKLNFSIDGIFADCDIFIYDNYLINGKIPYPFTECTGDFKAFEVTQLVSMKNFPNDVGKSCTVYGCEQLTSLEGAPKHVGGNFSCQKTPIKSLEGAPINVGRNFICDEVDYLESLEGAPKHVGGTFSCSKCPSLTSLDGLPTTIGGDLCCGEKFKGKEIPKNTIVNGNIIYYG